MTHKAYQTPCGAVDFERCLYPTARGGRIDSALSQQARDDAYRACTHSNDNRHRMAHPTVVAAHLPIGSGMTEEASKRLLKQRQYASCRRWKSPSANIVLSLKALTNVVERRMQFWQNIDHFGAECSG